jgi:hypothetical protein
MAPVRRPLALLLLALVLVASAALAAARAPLVPPAPAAVAEAVAALTTPEMEGRRSGTPGGERAAALIADWLRAAGLRPGGDVGSFLQSFVLSTGTRLAAGNALDIAGGASPVVGAEWIPHGGSAEGDVSAEVVFVGHGVIAPELGHDDYAGVDVSGRIALALAGAPARFGRRVPRVEKLVAARERGARALLVVDHALPELTATAAAAPLLSASIRPAVADALLPAGQTVAGLATDGAARAFATGRRVRLHVALQHTAAGGVNVLGLLPGHDPALAHEAVVVGAHYDHLGRVGGVVHPGADDNASGTAVVVELARAFAAAGGAPRTLVFALFGAEELGLVGSGHYVRQPTVPLASTVAMVNFDMVGRLRDHRVTVAGIDSADGLRDIVATSAGAESLTAALRGSPHGPSDHTRFYRAGVPVLFFHTGRHEDYHRPGDTADKLDVAGMARVAAVGARVVERLAAAPRPAYAKVAPPAGRRQAGTRAFLGVQGDAEPDGARLVGIIPGAAADRAGLHEGDVVIRLAGAPLASFDDLRAALRGREAGERVDVVYIRNGERRSVTATLDPLP